MILKFKCGYMELNLDLSKPYRLTQNDRDVHIVGYCTNSNTGVEYLDSYNAIIVNGETNYHGRSATVYNTTVKEFQTRIDWCLHDKDFKSKFNEILE